MWTFLLQSDALWNMQQVHCGICEIDPEINLYQPAVVLTPSQFAPLRNISIRPHSDFNAIFARIVPISQHIVFLYTMCPRMPNLGPVSLRLMTSQFKDIVTHTQKSKTVKCKFCGVWVQNFVWNFKGALWNFTQNFEPIHRKNANFAVYGFKILCEISKVPFEISHKILNPYTAKFAFYKVVKILLLMIS